MGVWHPFAEDSEVSKMGTSKIFVLSCFPDGAKSEITSLSTDHSSAGLSAQDTLYGYLWGCSLLSTIQSCAQKDLIMPF